MEISVNDSAGNHPTRFLADLTQAMRSTAEAARLSTIEQCRLDAQAYAEQVNARTKEESEQFRKSADADVATIREQSKARMELIRQETERRISRRRELLDRDLEEFNAAIGVEVESVQHRVEAFQSEVAEFFERLLQGGADPTVFATMASQIPDPPSFDELDPNTLASDLRARRQQAERGSEHEPEPAVIARIAQQENLRLLQGIRGSEHGVHQGQAHPAPLMCRKYAERAKPQRGTVVDPAPAAHDVPHDTIVRDGHERQTGDHVAIVAQRIHQRDLRWLAVVPPGERSGMNRGDRRPVGRDLSAHKHNANLGGAAPHIRYSHA